LGIRIQESGGNYQAKNPLSANGDGAEGAYQFIRSTWQSVGAQMKAAGNDAVSKYTSAILAPNAVQDLAFNYLMKQLMADSTLKNDPERWIAAWFQGPKVAAQDKSTWTTKLQPYNPTTRKYVDSVKNHISKGA